ncbi:hypothetical protein B0H19DRAFT_1261385 [Mycena capillaripes]|nr:hypothetical protein B0H19DRAFT_1261385 [Mycena capillaripes]
MTSFTDTSYGTESQPSVPVAAPGVPSNSAAAAAAFQSILNAMATLTHASSPGRVTAPVVVPAPVATSAPVVASAAPLVAPAAPVAPVGFRTRSPWEEVAADSLPYWYCITRGKYVGVTLSNALALAAVSGVSCSSMKAYKTQILAIESFNEMLAFGMVAVIAT